MSATLFGVVGRVALFVACAAFVGAIVVASLGPSGAGREAAACTGLPAPHDVFPDGTVGKVADGGRCTRSGDRATRLCRRAFGNLVAARATTVGDIHRTGFLGVSFGALFRDARPGELAAWCVARVPPVQANCYDEYAITADGVVAHVIGPNCDWASGRWPPPGDFGWTF